MAAPRILIADDQTAVREELAYAMKFEGYRTAEAPDGEAALAILAEGDVGAVLLDIKMPGLDGLQVLQRIREQWPGLPVIMITGHGDIETAVVAIKNGAFDFLAKPFDTDRVLVSIKNALHLRDLYSENQALRAERAEAFQLLGSSAAIREVRLVAATNQDLEAMVAQKEFREDLFWRLHVIRIQVPPLRERADDVELLAEHFLREACRRNGLPRRKLAADARAALRAMLFPGNVRELKNLIEATAILAEHDPIPASDLPGSAPPPLATTGGTDMFDYETLEDFRAAAEKEFIRRKLESNGGNIKRTAERIQIQRSNLYKKLERYGLK